MSCCFVVCFVSRFVFPVVYSFPTFCHRRWHRQDEGDDGYAADALENNVSADGGGDGGGDDDDGLIPPGAAPGGASLADVLEGDDDDFWGDGPGDPAPAPNAGNDVATRAVRGGNQRESGYTSVDRYATRVGELSL